MVMNMTGDGSGPSGPAQVIAPQRQRPPAVPGSTDPTPMQLGAQWHAYDGDFGSGGKLPTQPNVPDLNIESNRIKPIVNTGVDFLFGPVLRIKCSDDTAQAILDAVWGDDDQRMTLLSKSGITGGVYGHVFVKVIAPRRGVASLDNPPRLVLLNSEYLQVTTDPDDCDLVRCFTITYTTMDEKNLPMRIRQTVTRLDPDDQDASISTGEDSETSWVIQNSAASGLSGGVFVPVGPAIPWPFPLSPIIDWQNYPNPNAHWGQPDVTASLVALNTQLRLIESNINTIGFLQGHPFLYSTGADTSGLKPTPGQIVDLGSPDAKLGSVSGAGDLQQLMAFAEAVRSDMDEESGIPGVATGRLVDLPRGALSGVTVRLLYSPALARNEHKRRLYGQGIRQICQTTLLLCGYSMADLDTITIELGWTDPLPQDDVAQGQLALAKKQIGYSNHTLIVETGGDPDVEATYLAEEEATAAPPSPTPAGTSPVPPAPTDKPTPQQGNEG